MLSRKTKAFLTLAYSSYSAGAYVFFQGLIIEGLIPDWLMIASGVFAFIVPLSIVAYFIRNQHIPVPKVNFDLFLAVAGFITPVVAGIVAALLGDPDLGLNDVVFFLVGLIFGILGLYRGMPR